MVWPSVIKHEGCPAIGGRQREGSSSRAWLRRRTAIPVVPARILARGCLIRHRAPFAGSIPGADAPSRGWLRQPGARKQSASIAMEVLFRCGGALPVKLLFRFVEVLFRCGGARVPQSRTSRGRELKKFIIFCHENRSFQMMSRKSSNFVMKSSLSNENFDN